MLNNWEKSGYEYAQSKFLEHYHPTKKTKGEPHIENIISGKLDYLKMVKGEKDSTYLKLKNRFEKLVLYNSNENDSEIHSSHMIPSIQSKDMVIILNEFDELSKLLE